MTQTSFGITEGVDQEVSFEDGLSGFIGALQNLKVYFGATGSASSDFATGTLQSALNTLITALGTYVVSIDTNVTKSDTDDTRQSTHDNFNCNSNLQIANADVGVSNPLPVKAINSKTDLDDLEQDYDGTPSSDHQDITVTGFRRWTLVFGLASTGTSSANFIVKVRAKSSSGRYYDIGRYVFYHEDVAYSSGPLYLAYSGDVDGLDTLNVYMEATTPDGSNYYTVSECEFYLST